MADCVQPRTQCCGSKYFLIFTVYFVHWIVYRWLYIIHKAGMWDEVSNASQPSVFCFSLVKSEPTWPYPEDSPSLKPRSWKWFQTTSISGRTSGLKWRTVCNPEPSAAVNSSVALQNPDTGKPCSSPRVHSSFLSVRALCTNTGVTELTSPFICSALLCSPVQQSESYGQHDLGLLLFLNRFQRNCTQ